MKSLSFFISLYLIVHSHALTSRKKKGRRKQLKHQFSGVLTKPCCSSATCSLVALQRHPFQSQRLVNQPSPLDWLDLPQTNVTDMLRQQQKKDERLQRRHQTLHVLALAGSLGLLWLAQRIIPLTRAVASPLSFFMASVPWIVMRPSLQPKSLYGVLFQVYATLELLRQPQILAYIQTTLVPIVYKVMEKMLLIELWRQIWIIVEDCSMMDYRQLPQWIQVLPQGLQTPLLYIDGVFRRGAEKMIKKLVETSIEQRVGQLWATTQSQIAL